VNRPLRFAEPAADELRDSVRWYESRRAGLGAEFFDAVVATIETIQANPEIGIKRSSHSQTRRVLLDRFPYQIVYHLRSDELVIVAIAHLKRRPDYWKNRG
jgi:plasmid stabilization system protein ParE